LTETSASFWVFGIGFPKTQSLFTFLHLKFFLHSLQPLFLFLQHLLHCNKQFM
jgi:hypothetical protein